MNKRNNIFLIVTFCIAVLMVCINYYEDVFSYAHGEEKAEVVSNVSDSYEYTGSSYIELNGNEPDFTGVDGSASFEIYSELDTLDRAGVALASVGQDLMPVEKRGSIGMIKPSGWHTIKYDNVDGKYLYNRCHLIAYQLTGENANVKNLITCTRQMNTEGMIEFENKVASYVKKTNNHVLYRVTPVYEGDNLLATGVRIEALSVEDQGKGVKFNVFVFNVQDDIEIDYATGDSKLKEE